MTRRPFSYAQRGNILFLILLAVVLFAALSYAITSQRDGGKPLTTERAQALAASTLQYATLMENIVQRMLLSGVRVENLDFHDPGTGNDEFLPGTNASCLTPACEVFSREGGGATAIAIPPEGSDTTRTAFFTADGGARGDALLISVKDVGTPLADIVLLYRAIKEDLCRHINVSMGIHDASAALPVDGLGPNNNSGASGTDYASYDGALDPLPVLTPNVLGDYDSRLAGKRTMCVFRSTGSGYYFYHVLVAR